MSGMMFRHYDTRINKMMYSKDNPELFGIDEGGAYYGYNVPKSESGLEDIYYKSYDLDIPIPFVDCDDKVIFENDIVEVKGLGNCLVELNFQCGAGFTTEFGNTALAVYCWNDDNIGKILGNIYENPELMNKGE